MKKLVLVAVVLSVLAGTSAWAQLTIGQDPFLMTPRQLGMGGVGIAIADDAGAAAQNPAGLATLNIPVQDSSFSSDLIAFYADPPASGAYSGAWAGFSPKAHTGAGIVFSSIIDPGAPYLYSAGIGTRVKDTRVSLGLEYTRTQFPPWGGGIYSFGAMYRGGTVDFGARIDNFNRGFTMPAMFNAGLAWKPSSRLLLSVDATDLSDIFGEGIQYSFGGEFKIIPQLALRAGSISHFGESNTTFGAGWAFKGWRLDFGLVQDDFSNFWNAGLGLDF
jgi:hypothetical protein